jgi:hypothetical protein
MGRRHVSPATSAQEPCALCGEETAAGSVFFSDRLRLPRRGRPDAFLCGLCEARIRASHRPRRMTEEDADVVTRVGSAAAVTYWSRY